MRSNKYQPIRSLKISVLIPSQFQKVTHIYKKNVGILNSEHYLQNKPQLLLILWAYPTHTLWCQLNSQNCCPAPLGDSHSLPWKEGLHQLVVFPSLGIKVTVQTWVIQQSQHFLVLFHTQVFFTCGKGNHRHISC